MTTGRRALRFLVGATLLAAAAPLRAAPEAPSALRDAAVVRAVVGPGARARWEGRVPVPPDAVALGVVLDASADLDLYLRHREPVGDPADADVAAHSSRGQEVVSITPFSEAPLRAGAWHVLVTAPEPLAEAATFDLVAYVDRAAGPHTVLPGRAISATLPGEGARAAFRTFLPRSAVSLSLDVSAREAAGIHFDLDGPEGYGREGPGAPRLLVARAEAPAGTYTLTLTSSAERRPRRVTAQARWDLGPGDDLPAQSDPLLEPGQPLTFVMGGAEPDVRRLRVVVPRGTAALSLEGTAEDGGDVDLYVRRARPIEEGIEDADWIGLRTGSRERLVVGGEDALAPGVYHAWAVLLDDRKADEVTLSLERLPAGRGEATWGASPPPTLAEGVWVEGTLRPDASGITWHAVEVAVGAPSLSARLVESSAPLDLLFARPSDGAVVARSLTPRVDESLTLEFERPLARPRRLLVGVLCRESGENLVQYRIAATSGRPAGPPQDLRWPPVMDGTGLTPLERAAAGTVELMTEDGGGGSGTCVSPRGLLLTSRHVLEGADGEGVQRRGVLVAFPQRLDAPPAQAFLAQVIREDADLDLALLRLTEDVFGRPLPEDLALPWIPLADAAAVRLGDPLVAFGYPEGGSTRTRTAIVSSRGSVSGFERAPGFPPWVKTDAWIAPGHSGGPLVDGEGRLVGLAVATLGTGERLGLALPVDALPSEWKSLLDKELR